VGVGGVHARGGAAYGYEGSLTGKYKAEGPGSDRPFITTTMDQVKAHPDTKTTDIAIEDAEAIYAKKLDRDDSEEVPVSPLKDMPRRQAVWVFRKAVLFAMLVAWAAIMDGYLISSEYTSYDHHTGRLLTRQFPARSLQTSTSSLNSAPLLRPTAAVHWTLYMLEHGLRCNQLDRL
jgi:hypothetical protein